MQRLAVIFNRARHFDLLHITDIAAGLNRNRVSCLRLMADLKAVILELQINSDCQPTISCTYIDF